MNGDRSPRTSLDSLRKEAKRWLKALHARDEEARARLAQAWPDAPAAPGLRDVQHALAREHGFASWARLKADIAAQQQQASGDARATALDALLKAAWRGDVTRLVETLNAHPDIIDERGALGSDTGLRTALHYGVRHEAIVRALVERGANPNIRDEGDHAFPLHFAAEGQDLPVIRLLIEHGADPIGTGDDHELEVIGWATGFDYLTTNPDVVSYLLAHGARHNIFSATALGEADAVRAIVAQTPADRDRPMDRTNHRRRPLHLAVVKKQPAALAALVDLGADLDARDAAGLSALDQAALDHETGMAQLLLDRGAPLTLPAAVALGRPLDIERLLADSPHALRPGGPYGTLIVRACERSGREVVETLIRLGASVNVHDDTTTSVDATPGYTPLHAAAMRANADVVPLLLEHGADPTIREAKYCATAAGWADYFHHPEVRDRILEGPIDIFDAIHFDRADRIADILDRDPGALNRRFGDYPFYPLVQEQMPQAAASTPLTWAVWRNRADAARLLLERGAERTLAPDGRTLEEVASEPGREAVAEVLREHQAQDRARSI